MCRKQELAEGLLVPPPDSFGIELQCMTDDDFMMVPEPVKVVLLASRDVLTSIMAL